MYSKGVVRNKSEKNAKPYCQCMDEKVTLSWAKEHITCSCGEDNKIREWCWEKPIANNHSWVVVSEDRKQVTFHPVHSSGTAAVRGDTPLRHDYHYYWEIKMLTITYGTDITIGVGTDKINTTEPVFEFTSLLGHDAESYGLSFTGQVRHNATAVRDLPGFVRGSIIGVRVDMWHGTLEFKLNRCSQGISFYNLRRHPLLYPMISSTAAQSSMRLIYAASWKASLLVDAAKTLAAVARLNLPPGLRRTMSDQFWLTLPTEEGSILDEIEMESMDEDGKVASHKLGELFPLGYVNGFYMDSVAREYRIIIRD